MEKTRSVRQLQQLKPNELRRLCKPASLGFKTTNDLPDLQEVIGQPRAIRALQLGSEVSGPGYNTFVLGVSGSGRTTLSLEYLQRKAANEPVPDDWCYVNNFDNPRQPSALRLPAGSGFKFSQDIQKLIQHSALAISRTFESDEYIQERDRLLGEQKKGQEAEFIRLQKHTEKYSFIIVRTPFGFALVPAVQGKPLKPEEIETLSGEQRDKLSQLQTKLEEEVEKTLRRMREIETLTNKKLKELNEHTVLFSLGPLIDELKTKYSGQDSVLSHLEAIQQDILANADQFRAKEVEVSAPGTSQPTQRDWVHRYEVNVLVDHSQDSGAPVIHESHPSYTNLLGRIEHEVIMGASRTDFTMIQPGALHLANGGYLILPAHDLLTNPYAWDGLKRVLRDGELRIVELANQLGLLSTVTLEPEPIPLHVKVFLVGTPLLYYLLRYYDEDFAKLFKVRAEFGTTMERNPETEREYGLFVKSVVEDNKLPAFDRTAIARIIDYSSRLAEDQTKLSTRFGKIADLVRESAYWWKITNPAREKFIRGSAVQRAIEESIYRSNLVEERVQDLITQGTILIDVTGKAIGQVNALSVILLGDYSFGRPSRVTASAFPGKRGVVDIERQAEMGGPIHTKGVLILTGYLGRRYGREKPLSLSAHLTFEQSYEGVEGDSASAAELFALLSAIADVPLRQDLAITGSVNQRGQIQPVGGINEKIEGFFTTCKLQGLTGEQGVIIPANNVSNLMLSDEVVTAVEKGQFHIWPIQTVDEGLQLLSGIEPGVPQEDGSYSQDTFNYTLMEHLKEFARVEKAKDSETSEDANPSTVTDDRNEIERTERGTPLQGDR
jgi:lon-related putative ATP-dependent protease